MKNPMALIRAQQEPCKKRPITSDDFGLRSSVIEKPFQTKSATSIVAPVSAQCGPGDKCRKRYAAASLDKGQVPKLKCAMIEQLGKHSDWDPVGQRENLVASPPVRGYLANAQEEQR